MHKSVKITILLVVALGLLTACNQGSKSQTGGTSTSTTGSNGSQSTPSSGAPTLGEAPDIGYTTFDGQAGKISDHRGRPLVVNFWAAWCPPCKAEMPEFEDIYKKYDGQFDLIAIAVDTRNDPTAFFSDKGFTYTGAMGGRDVAMYVDRSIPVTAFIDRRGELVHKHVGRISIEAFELHLKKIL